MEQELLIAIKELTAAVGDQNKVLAPFFAEGLQKIKNREEVLRLKRVIDLSGVEKVYTGYAGYDHVYSSLEPQQRFADNELSEQGRMHVLLSGKPIIVDVNIDKDCKKWFTGEGVEIENGL